MHLRALRPNSTKAVFIWRILIVQMSYDCCANSKRGCNRLVPSFLLVFDLTRCYASTYKSCSPFSSCRHLSLRNTISPRVARRSKPAGCCKVSCAVGHGNSSLVTATRSQPWLGRSHMRRDLPSVYRCSVCYCSPFLATILY